jgi:hypothetical protein
MQRNAAVLLLIFETNVKVSSVSAAQNEQRLSEITFLKLSMIVCLLFSTFQKVTYLLPQLQNLFEHFLIME